MPRYAALVILLYFGTGFKPSHGIEVNVTEDNKLCLYANLMLNFSVSYETTDNKMETVVFELPNDATTSSSTCGNSSSVLKLLFGDGHSWSVDFTRNDTVYRVDKMTFIYNLSDAKLFPKSSSNETVSVTGEPETTNIGVNTYYSCKTEELFRAGSNVNMTFWNVLIQAFVVNGSKSDNKTSCAADVPVTPTPTPHVTNTTTAAPVTNTTTVPSTTPTPTLPTPVTGNYTVDQNGTVCLLATFGLRIAFEQKEMNFNSSAVHVTGSCGANQSMLMLESDDITLRFTFITVSKKFSLHVVNVTIKIDSGDRNLVNNNLSLWEASVGSSYMCNKEQNFNVSNELVLHTFNLHVQPFGVKKGMFSTAHECSLDDPSILIPIIVGAALAGLILIVVIAYVIGRRRTYVGYQTL